MIELFQEFLVERDLEDKYFRNLFDDASPLSIDEWRNLVDTSPLGLIVAVFEWDYTPEGSSFWSNIDNEWKTFLTKYYENLSSSSGNF